MRICDRCFNKDGSAVRAVDEVAFERSSELFDLCESCMNEMREMVDNPPKPIAEELPKRATRGRKRARKNTDTT